jgi:hypothetical protein
VTNFVLFRSKAEGGRREIASLPKVDSPAAQVATEEDADDEDEIDMTATPSPVTRSPLASPSASPSRHSAAAAAVKKSPPIQDVDMNLFETYESASFPAECCPELIRRFEAEEAQKAMEKEQAKEQAEADKAAATKARKKVSNEDDAPAKPVKKAMTKEEGDSGLDITDHVIPVASADCRPFDRHRGVTMLT